MTRQAQLYNENIMLDKQSVLDAIENVKHGKDWGEIKIVDELLLAIKNLDEFHISIYKNVLM